MSSERGVGSKSSAASRRVGEGDGGAGGKGCTELDKHVYPQERSCGYTCLSSSVQPFPPAPPSPSPTRRDAAELLLPTPRSDDIEYRRSRRTERFLKVNNWNLHFFF